MDCINWRASEIHKDTVLAWLWYRMSQEERQNIMLECPQAYNSLCGSEVVKVVRVSDGTPVIRGEIRTTRIVFGGEDE